MDAEVRDLVAAGAARDYSTYLSTFELATVLTEPEVRAITAHTWELLRNAERFQTSEPTFALLEARAAVTVSAAERSMELLARPDAATGGDGDDNARDLGLAARMRYAGAQPSLRGPNGLNWSTVAANSLLRFQDMLATRLVDDAATTADLTPLRLDEQAVHAFGIFLCGWLTIAFPSGDMKSLILTVSDYQDS